MSYFFRGGIYLDLLLIIFLDSYMIYCIIYKKSITSIRIKDGSRMDS